MTLEDTVIKKNTRKEKKYANDALTVVELFAGVGGFRIGLEKVKNKENELLFKTIWANQWEPPGGNEQIAAEIYRRYFKATEGKDFENNDISTIIEQKFESIPDHQLLVGGFPCQDYSVARVLSEAVGIVGQKGVLWWSIYNILHKKKNKRPKYLMLENVDRLLKSPASRRGRDFAVMLASLYSLGYAVEWRVINAADYGMPQKRRRIFILGYHESSRIYKQIKTLDNPVAWMMRKGPIARKFPVINDPDDYQVPFVNKSLWDQDFLDIHIVPTNSDDDIKKISDYFNVKGMKSPFRNAGMLIDGKVSTLQISPKIPKNGKTLKWALLDESKIKNIDDYYIPEEEKEKWRELKGSKKIPRVNKKTGHEYEYSEGKMPFPDPLDRPARTIVTGEGGSAPSRFKHVIEGERGKDTYRRLAPEELEKLNMFPRGITRHPKATPIKRAFLMGNALVVGVVEKLGRGLIETINS